MAKAVFCAAVDLGASSGRVILGSWGKGETGSTPQLDLKEVHRFPNAFHSLGGYDYWDIPGLWTEISRGLHAATTVLPKGAKLASVGVDSWGVDYVLTNGQGRPVFPTHAYRDKRTQAGLVKLLKNQAALRRIYAATGIPAVFYNSSFQLAETITTCPAITDLAERCLFLPDYFGFLLSGKMANGLSIGSTSQLLNVHTDDWSHVALDYFHVPSRWLSLPIPSGTKLGYVQGFSHLKQTQVISVPGHDTTCAYDAMPATPDGSDILISSGTWSLVGFESETPLLGPRALAARIANDRTGRGNYRPLINVIGLWLLEGTLKDFAARPTNHAAWVSLIRAATNAPPPRLLLDITDPAFTNPPSMKAAIDAQLRRRRKKLPQNLAGYVRLICNSLGQGHADAIKIFTQLSGRTFRRILMVGGGSKNPLLCQSTADASCLPVVSYALEGTAVGNLGNQLIALGEVESLAAFRMALGAGLKKTTFHPKPFMAET